MTRLTTLSLAHRTVVMLLALLTIAIGVFSATALRQELIPAMDLPRGAVVSVYAGASPDVVEAQVSRPIEAAVKGVEGVTSVTSTSSSSVSQVSLQWEYGHDADKIASDLRAALDGLRGLPSGVTPRVVIGGFGDLPVMIVALASDADLTTLSQQAEAEVLPALKALPGVRDVTLAGEEVHEVVITYDEAKLRDAGVDPAMISQLFLANATAFPSGTIRTDAANLDVQTGTTYATVDELKGLWLQGSEDPVRLGDVATVVEQPTEVSSISRVNGRPSLTLSVTKTTGANTVAVAHEVKNAMAGLEQRLGHNASFATVFDQSPFIEQSIHDLSVEGGLGLAMAVLVIFVFLRSIRPTLITAVSIPLALLMALVGLWVGGYTLNILTLGALTVAIGRVVDDSIVVIENVQRHQASGGSGRASIVAAVREVAGAVTASTLTTAAVFVPIGLVGGQAGEMFRPFALTVSIALLASLLVSLTIVPVLASWFMRRTVEAAVHDDEAETNSWLHRAYMPVLSWSLGHRVLTLAIAAGIFVGTLALTPLLKTDFIGSMGQDSLVIAQELPPGTGLQATETSARRIEAMLAEDPDVQTYQTTIGGSSSLFMGQQEGANQAHFNITLKPKSTPRDVAARLRGQLQDAGNLGQVDVTVGANQQGSSVVVYVESSDPDTLARGSQQVVDLMATIPALANVSSDLGDAKELLQIDIDEAKAASLGMTQVAIGQAVSRVVHGQQIGTLAVGERTLNVFLRSQQPVKSVDELRQVKLPVTQKMTMTARLDAADSVTARQTRMQDRAKAEAADAFNDQLVALRDARRKASEGAKTLETQLSAARAQLGTLQASLEKAQQAAAAGVDPSTVTQSVFQLTQAVSGVTQQVVQLSQAEASAKGQVDALAKQIDGLTEQRAKTESAQADQQDLADAGKAAQKLNADPVTLADFAEVRTEVAPGTITRVDGIRAATISATNEGGDLGATTTAIKDGLAQLDLPDGVTVRMGGISEMQQESFRQLGLAMAVAVAVVYLIMVATFGSLLQPLILLVSIPFAATGALGLSLVTGTPIGVPSMIGMLMLIGIVVTNAIVLIDLINQKRAIGAGVDAAIEAGARLRLRPIVMTALATIFALIPMAMGLTGGGVFISKPLGIIVIGGLVSSTLLTLILVPVLYDLVEKGREGFAHRRARRSAGEDESDVTEPDASTLP